jgi:hypothetical protein
MATEENAPLLAVLRLPAGAASAILVTFLKRQKGPKPNHLFPQVPAMSGANAAMNQPDKLPGSAPAGEPAAAPIPPPPVSLNALELPPELKKDVEDRCRRARMSAIHRRDVEHEMKLQFFFGGQDVAYMTKGGDMLVIAAGDMYSEAFDRVLAALPREERRQVTLYSPSPWNDTESHL